LKRTIAWKGLAAVSKNLAKYGKGFLLDFVGYQNNYVEIRVDDNAAKGLNKSNKIAFKSVSS